METEMTRVEQEEFVLEFIKNWAGSKKMHKNGTHTKSYHH